MSAILFPVLQFWNAAGTSVLANGTISTYQTGTTTPLATYTDSTGLTAAPNPIPLDAGGRPNNNHGMWLNSISAYDLIIRDSNGATITTLTNVVVYDNGIAPSNASYLTTSPEASLTNEKVLSGTANQIILTTVGNTATLSIPYQLDIGPSQAGPSEIRMYEDTDNGSNKITLIAPATITANQIITLPEATGTVYVSNGSDVAVADGGTGASSATAYGVITGGTTATGPYQSISPGTVGQALVSAGNAAVPAFGTLGVTGGGTGAVTNNAYGVLTGGITATGAVQSVAPGTAGYVLKSAGAGALPIWDRPGSEIYLSTVTASAASSVDFTGLMSSTYRSYRIYFFNLSQSVAQVIQLLFGAAGTYNTSSNYSYVNEYTNYNGSTYAAAIIGSGTTFSAGINLTPTLGSLINNTNGGSSGVIDIVGDRAVMLNIIAKMTLSSASAVATYAKLDAVGSFRASTAAITATDVRILSASGTITGTFHFYGII